MADGALPAPARMAAEAAYRNWRIGGDGEGRLHAALLAYAAAVQADADQSLTDRMVAMETAIRASERERTAAKLAAIADYCKTSARINYGLVKAEGVLAILGSEQEK